MANVLNFGADPTGVADSTAAIVAAIAATPDSGTVCFPYTSSGGTYLCDPDTINPAGKRLVGDKAHATNSSTIRTRIAGTALIPSSSKCGVEHLILDSNSLSNYGLQLTGADDSIIYDVTCKNALAWGVYMDESLRVLMRYVDSSFNANGFYVLGCDEAEFYGCSGNVNTNVGLHVLGVGSALTANNGNIKWYAGGLDLNTNGPQAIFDGVIGASMVGGYVEGASPGIRLQNEVANCSFEFIRVVTGDLVTDFAFELLEASNNTFIGGSAGGSNGIRMWIDSALSQNNTFVGCYRASFLAVEEMKLYFDNGVGGTYTCEQRQGGFVGSAAPTQGTWRTGDIVWNSGATPVGWRCTVAGNPGTWTAF